MSKCQACGIESAVWAWQPFGPDESPTTMTLLGSHYRGFPVIKVCSACKQDIQAGYTVEFTYQAQRYVYVDTRVIHVPEYISDVLAWLEDL